MSTRNPRSRVTTERAQVQRGLRPSGTRFERAPLGNTPVEKGEQVRMIRDLKIRDGESLDRLSIDAFEAVLALSGEEDDLVLHFSLSHDTPIRVGVILADRPEQTQDVEHARVLAAALDFVAKLVGAPEG